MVSSIINEFDLPKDETLTGTTLWVRVSLGVIAMKRYSTFPKASELEPHHQMQFSVILRTSLCSRCILVSYHMALELNKP